MELAGATLAGGTLEGWPGCAVLPGAGCDGSVLLGVVAGAAVVGGTFDGCVVLPRAGCGSTVGVLAGGRVVAGLVPAGGTFSAGGVPGTVCPPEGSL